MDSSLEATPPVLAGRPGTIVVDADPAAWVVGDEARLMQVVTNLLNNALRFDADEEIVVSVRVQNGQAVLAVSGHGIGMTAEQTQQVFAPFYEAPQSLARSAGGLGLGLAIARSIVELHAGSPCSGAGGGAAHAGGG